MTHDHAEPGTPGEPHRTMLGAAGYAVWDVGGGARAWGRRTAPEPDGHILVVTVGNAIDGDPEAPDWLACRCDAGGSVGMGAPCVLAVALLLADLLPPPPPHSDREIGRADILEWLRDLRRGMRSALDGHPLPPGDPRPAHLAAVAGEVARLRAADPA